MKRFHDFLLLYLPKLKKKKKGKTSVDIVAWIFKEMISIEIIGFF